MPKKLEGQARELHQVVTELVKRYQFRDRQEICCHGISVSQCYTLAALNEAGELTMGELAQKMQLTVSTMTRVVDQLVDKTLVERCIDPKDRRVCCVELTPQGSELLENIHGEILEIEKEVLKELKVEERDNLIKAFKTLIGAVDGWREKHRNECC